MKKYIVTTTIHEPTEAILEYSKMKDWSLIVVADKKTPHRAFNKVDCYYLDPDVQNALFPTISELLGWNCLERKNIGFLLAHQEGADIIASIDDDNIPLEGWGEDLLIGKEVDVAFRHTESLCFDPLFSTGHRHLWHRGFPVSMLKQREKVDSAKIIKCDIQASLWNGDPDVDAICRMIYSPDVMFENNIRISTNTFTPFNTQNTFFSREAIEHMFMFPDTGRMDDIWGAFFCETFGHNVVYTDATVNHDRHYHNLYEDHEKELLGMKHTEGLLVDLRRNRDLMSNYVSKRAWDAWLEYSRLMK